MSMRSMTLAFLAHAAFTGMLAYADVPQEVDTRSEPVSLGQGDYRLIVRGDANLVLEHTYDRTTTRWLVKPIELRSDDGTRRDNWLVDDDKTRIEEVALSRWGKTGLVAVVRLPRGERAAFWALTFPRACRHQDDAPCKPTATLLSIEDASYRILALSGSRRAPTITAVLGKPRIVEIPFMGEVVPGLGGLGVESGVILMHGCPNPGPLDAPIGRFEPTYEVDEGE